MKLPVVVLLEEEEEEGDDDDDATPTLLRFLRFVVVVLGLLCRVIVEFDAEEDDVAGEGAGIREV